MKGLVCMAALMLAVCFCPPAIAADPSVAAHLQEISVTIDAKGAEGSGVIFARDGQCFCWTAGHVVDGLRRTRKVIREGSERTVVEFDDARIVKHLVESGRGVGRLELDAEVLWFSDADHGEDLALLRVRKDNAVEASVEFYPPDEAIPPIGTPLLHVGSLLGSMGSNSMTSGIMSQHGRLIGKTVYDQTTVTAFPGSSGGGVYLTDGRYVGMLVRGAGEGFNLVVPVRRIYEAAERAGILWALDPKAPLPSEAELKELPIEDL